MSKKLVLLLICCLCVATVFAQPLIGHEAERITDKGLGLGSVIAVVISWSRNKSILWAIIHGICSWFYVIYYYFVLKNKD